METESQIIRGADRLDAFVRAAAAAPRAAALFCDIDGTISPIALRPESATVPDRFRDLLAELIAQLGFVAFVSGRTLADARRMVRLDGAAYVGNHGLELMTPDGAVETDARAEQYIRTIQEVAGRAARDLDCHGLGIVLEDKRTVLTIHYRLAPDPAKTRHEILTHVIEPARAQGLNIATGHFAFEVRPPLSFSKGAVIRRLLDGGAYWAALSCGDDMTDISGFTALREWAAQDGRRAACALAAVTDETPRPVTDAADVLVKATPGVLVGLKTLRAVLGD